MVKRQVVDLTHEGFAFFVKRLTDEFRSKKIKYNLVGGVAVQARLLEMLTRKHSTDVTSLVLREDDSENGFRLQDYIRPTDDVDIALESRGNDPSANASTSREMREIYDQVKGYTLLPEGLSSGPLFDFICLRDGMRRPIFVISDGRTHLEIKLNISKDRADIHRLDPKFYDLFIDQGEEVNVPYDTAAKFRLYFRTPRLEHILATKLVSARGKDLMDAQNLITLSNRVGDRIDPQAVEQVLLPLYPGAYEQFVQMQERAHKHES